MVGASKRGHAPQRTIPLFYDKPEHLWNQSLSMEYKVSGEEKNNLSRMGIGMTPDRIEGKVNSHGTFYIKST